MRQRRQKNDRRDTLHLLDVLVRGDFSTVWRPAPEEREQRMVIRHLTRLIRQRTRGINVLRALVYNYNMRIP